MFELIFCIIGIFCTLFLVPSFQFCSLLLYIYKANISCRCWNCTCVPCLHFMVKEIGCVPLIKVHYISQQNCKKKVYTDIWNKEVGNQNTCTFVLLIVVTIMIVQFKKYKTVKFCCCAVWQNSYNAAVLLWFWMMFLTINTIEWSLHRLPMFYSNCSCVTSM